jgi:multisubunit Na+/H+ antiporter MnhG subunit
VTIDLTAFFVVLGATGVAGGAWPLLAGRNYPGWLGRGFTQGGSLRLKRAPTIYFRATGATVTSAGLVNLYVAYLMALSSMAGVVELATAAVLGALVFVALFGSLAWMLVLAYRHKLFRWNAP